MRRAARVDANQPEIVAAVRRMGGSVLHLHKVGDDAPDLLVGYRGRDQLVEIKTRTGKVRDDQLEWHAGWQGRRVVVWRSVEDAIMGMTSLGATRFNEEGAPCSIG